MIHGRAQCDQSIVDAASAVSHWRRCLALVSVYVGQTSSFRKF